MIIKSIVLAAILFLGSLGIAAGQSADSSVSSGTALGQLGQTDPSKPIAAVVLGYNFYHVLYCATFSGFLAFVAREDTSAWFTNDVATVAALTPACQTGNLVAFHVINANGVFDQTLVYPFK